MVVLPAVEALPLGLRRHALVARNPGTWPDASNTDYLVPSHLPRHQVFEDCADFSVLRVL